MNTSNQWVMKYIHIDKTEISVTSYGNEFILLHSTEKVNLIPYGEAIYNAQLDFAEEVISTEDEICIKTSNSLDDVALHQLSEIEIKKRSSVKKYILPIYFGDQEDWQALEKYSDKTKNEIIEHLCSLDLTFHMYGFLPGFLYVKGLPEYLQIPRKAIPAKRLPAGTLAIGGPYLGLYSNSSPGGWHSIGLCPLIVFDINNVNSTQMSNGDFIQLKSINHQQYSYILEQKLALDAYG